MRFLHDGVGVFVSHPAGLTGALAQPSICAVANIIKSVKCVPITFNLNRRDARSVRSNGRSWWRRGKFGWSGIGSWGAALGGFREGSWFGWWCQVCGCPFFPSLGGGVKFVDVHFFPFFPGIAIEVELTRKSLGRYAAIIAEHLHNIRQNRYHFVWYYCKNSVDAKSYQELFIRLATKGKIHFHDPHGYTAFNPTNTIEHFFQFWSLETMKRI